MVYEIRQCSNVGCKLRFPVADEQPRREQCPRCGATTVVAVTLAPSLEAQHSHLTARPSVDVHVFLDNLRSVYNVGSIFRTADGAGVAHLHLGGITPTPTHPKFAKTALGADKRLSWTHHLNGVEAVGRLKQTGWTVWAVEETAEATSLYDLDLSQLPRRLLLIFGHEVVGVDPIILALCDSIVSLPMCGVKRSLNVTVAFGAAVYHLLHAGRPS